MSTGYKISEPDSLYAGISLDKYVRLRRSLSRTEGRPDADGYLTLAEVNAWYNAGSGKPLYAD
jgi:hypothetical protein